MTIQELRVFLQSWMCGCGMPELAVERLRDILALHPLYDHRAEFQALVPDTGLEYMLLYMLDHLGLTEHGGGIGGGWLTDEGKAVLAAIQTHGAKAACESSCMHGYALEGDELAQCPECGPMNSRPV